jgi:hypothetical protein
MVLAGFRTPLQSLSIWRTGILYANVHAAGIALRL